MAVERSPFMGTQVFRFCIAVLLFAMLYCQAPLYYSNQNQYFLHGLAKANVGFLSNDWLANTLDPTPLFSTLVGLTVQFLHEWVFHFYYLCLMGVYLLGSFLIFQALREQRGSKDLVVFYFALFALAHCAALRWVSYRLAGFDYPWFLQAGVAGQYVLGAMFQPSTFGVFLVLGIALFINNRIWLGTGAICLAGILHTTYLLPGAMLILGFQYSLCREGNCKKAMQIGIAALALVMPTVIYSYLTFRGRPGEETALAQEILVHLRIPHHCLPELWLDGIAWIQILWVVFSLVLIRGSKLGQILSVAVIFGIFLTLAQYFTQSNTLALLFPWRVSAILVPIATMIVIAKTILAIRDSLDGLNKIQLARLLILMLAFAGAAIQVMREGFQTNEDEQVTLRSVSLNKAKNDLYMIPFSVPKLKKTTRGSLSSDFKPLAAKKIDTRIVPVEFQGFRLATGAPIYVDFKSIPYEGKEVLEWRSRLQKNLDWQAAIAEGLFETIFLELQAAGITHCVIPATNDILSPNAEITHQGTLYKIYRLKKKQ